MKLTKKILALILAALAAFAMLAACGGGEEGGGESVGEPVDGEAQSWGNITVFVPDASSLVGGSVTDTEDPDTAWILADENNTHYYKIYIVADAETAAADVSMTKEINYVNGGAGDVDFEIDGVKWTGFAYIYGSSCDCFQVYAQIGGKCVVVMAAYHAYDSAESTAVLGSISVK